MTDDENTINTPSVDTILKENSTAERLDKIQEKTPDECFVCGDDFIHYNQPHNNEMTILQAKDPTCITVDENGLHVFHHSDVDGPDSSPI